jgi:1-deoxy-D-xylulose-5-phosphate reductoisomerase
MPRNLAVLGCTGSIGESTLAVVREHPDRFRVVGLAAHGRWPEVARQVREFSPARVALADAGAAAALRREVPCPVLEGPGGVVDVATAGDVDTVVAGISGAAGLLPVLEAIRAGKAIALANKEVLVAAGALVTELVARHGVALLPIDSEHSAIMQCLKGEPRGALSRILLTASGGPFRGRKQAELDRVTPEDALRHPNWQMGAKITVDSSTLMNKGLEVIEARWLFDVPYERIQVVIHPQSIVHSLVEFCDGSVIAQLGVPDMKLAILCALTHPERAAAPHVPRLDLARLGSLTFEPPDLETFRCLALAIEVGRRARSYPTVLNAANEIAVARFLARDIGYTAIPHLLEDVLAQHRPWEPDRLEAVLEADRWARAAAAAWTRSSEAGA